jgi:alanine-synthesizing transaminase
VQTALGGHQSIFQLTNPGGRLYESRAALLAAVASSEYLSLVKPMGAMYGFVRVNQQLVPQFDDQRFAFDLLEQKHVLVAPGTSFNVSYRDHFRTTFLPDHKQINDVFGRVHELLAEYAKDGG